jgi:hypothetical protein
LSFTDVARTIAVPLAAQSFLPTKDPKQTKLLIMVYWGTTSGVGGASSAIPGQDLNVSGRQLSSRAATTTTAVRAPNPRLVTGACTPKRVHVDSDQAATMATGQAAESEFASALATMAVGNRERAKDDWQRAQLLGYDFTLAAAAGTESTALRNRQQDLIDEIEDDRYFVVLMAYDFQSLWKENKQKLLWETRISVRQGQSDFAKQFAAMTEKASRYFGQDSHGLIRTALAE